MNIYEQQWQFGRFLKAYYNKQSVVLNDIGAASFQADMHTTDLVGLADIEILHAKRAGMLDATFIDSLTASRNARICVTYEDWWYPARWIGDDGLFHHGQAVGIPQGWVKCGSWKIDDNVICGHEQVDFYACTNGEAEYLRHSLRRFSDSLPLRIHHIVYEFNC